MNTKLLKQKILDLAIRGKLTQQLKSDGTAKDLLKQISEQKRESSSTLSSPRRRGSPSAQSEKTIIPLDKSEAPFEIPVNWEWVRLGDVCELLNGDRSSNYPNKNEYVVCGVAWINTGHIRPDGFLDEKTMNYITEEKYNSLGNGKIHKFDLVYCLRGATFGKVARVEPFEKGAIASSLMIIRPILSQMRDFLYRCLKTDFAMNQLRKFDNGSAQPNLAAKDVSRYFVPLPPLAEQQRIVEKIQEAFTEIDSIENNKELLKTHIKQARQKILDLAIHGKLVPQNKADEPARVLLERITRDNPHYEKMGLDERRETKDERDSNYKRHSREGGNLLAPISKDEIPFDIPENWIWCRLKDIANYGECDNVEVKRIPETAWILELEDIEKDSGKILHFFSKSERQINGVRHQFEKGDVLYSKLRTYLNKVLVASNDGYCTTEIMPIKTTFISNHYLCMVLRSRYFLDYTAMCGYGVKMPRLSTNDAKNGLIPLPPLNEQSRIVAKIDELFSALDQMEKNLV